MGGICGFLNVDAKERKVIGPTANEQARPERRRKVADPKRNLEALQGPPNNNTDLTPTLTHCETLHLTLLASKLFTSLSIPPHQRHTTPPAPSCAARTRCLLLFRVRAARLRLASRPYLPTYYTSGVSRYEQNAIHATHLNGCEAALECTFG